jgi:hypothetical protein
LNLAIFVAVLFLALSTVLTWSLRAGAVSGVLGFLAEAGAVA